MIYFVGAGPGSEDLITVRGQRYLTEADIVIYAGSLVNPELLKNTKEGCLIYNSAHMTLPEVIRVMEEGEKNGKMTVRLHTGDPCLYGAIREQMEELEQRKISYEVCPGVSSFCGAAAALSLEYTLPGISQSVIITRAEGRTPVPERESLRNLAAHQSTMVLFLSSALAREVSGSLIEGGYAPDTPAAVVYKATWPEERKFFTTLSELPERMREEGISRTALIIVGNVIDGAFEKSKLYDPAFTTGYRKGTDSQEKTEAQTDGRE